jgi:hypothetical protein
MKKPVNMTNEQWVAYRARVARRNAAQKKALETEPILVQVGVMTAEIEAGTDNTFGTTDDDVDIIPTKSLPKSQLLKMAKKRGIEVSKKASKEEILALLN